MRELSDGEKKKLAEMKIEQAYYESQIIPSRLMSTSEANILEVKESIACMLKLVEEAIDLGAIEFREANIKEWRRKQIEEHRRRLEARMIKPYEGTVESLKNMKVDELELTVRAMNCLKDMHITSVYELVQHTASQLAGSRYMAKKSLCEIEGKLADIGLMLKQEEV